MNLVAWLHDIHQLPVGLLIATDFDGTLADICAKPEQAALRGDAREALIRLKNAGVRIAVVSGRSLADLRQRLGGLAGLWLAGERGAEIETPEGTLLRASPLPPGASHRLLAAWRAVAEACPGAQVEGKPNGATFHFREVAPEWREGLVSAASAICRARGAEPIVGRMAIEADFGAGDKRTALREIHRTLGEDLPVVYAGDDAVDIPAFQYVREQRRSLALHVGSPERPRPGCAVHGILEGPGEWVRVMHQIADALERKSA